MLRPLLLLSALAWAAPAQSAPVWTPSTVRAAIDAGSSDVRACANQGEPVSGEVTLRWMVGGDGRPVTTDVVRDTLADAPLVACVREAAAAWRFPEPPAGSAVVLFSFVIRS
jgi:hypothetical protein